MPYLHAHCYTNFRTKHDIRVLPGSIWHCCIQCYQLQFLPEGALSNPNISTVTTTLLHKTQCHIITSTEVTTALLPDLPFWHQNLPPIIYYLCRPGPPWPPPTTFPRVPIPTANTEPPTDHPTATRPSCAWQPTDHLTCKPLCAIALPTYQYHHTHLSRQPKFLWDTRKRVTTTTPTTADKNLI